MRTILLLILLSLLSACVVFPVTDKEATRVAKLRCELSSDKKTEWANYRTSLRDLTNTYKSVSANGFSWPTEPS